MVLSNGYKCCKCWGKHMNNYLLSVRAIIPIAFLVLCTLFAGVSFSQETDLLDSEELNVLLSELSDVYASSNSFGFRYNARRESVSGNSEPSTLDIYCVIDSTRIYFEGDERWYPESIPSNERTLAKYNWNDELYSSLDVTGNTGQIRASYVQNSIIGPVVDVMFYNYQKKSIVDRIQKYGNERFSARIVDNDHVEVFETHGAGAVQKVQSRIFDKSKNYAIVSMSNIIKNNDTGEETVFYEIEFSDYVEQDGIFIPRKIEKRSFYEGRETKRISTFTEIEVNSDEHESYLQGFTFPEGANIYDYILKAPLTIGGDFNTQEIALSNLVDAVEAEQQIPSELEEVVEKISMISESDGGSTSISMKSIAIGFVLLILILIIFFIKHRK